MCLFKLNIRRACTHAHVDKPVFTTQTKMAVFLFVHNLCVNHSIYTCILWLRYVWLRPVANCNDEQAYMLRDG